ncbi:MAG TPA: PEGA domain-containing protein, partial [Polyangium sp.]|nr:PEGA domain-containing protein [Polyangium sp.]
MRSSSGRLTSLHTAAVLTSLLALTASPAAYAQAKAPAAAPAAPAADKKPAAAAPAKKDEKAAAPAKKDEKAAAAPAKKDEKAAAAKPAKPLTDKQKKDIATQALKDGDTAFEKGEFQAAFDAYKTADETLPGLNAKFKVAVALEKLNKVQEAVAAYQGFLAAIDEQAADKKKKFDPKKWEDRVTEAKAKIEALKKTPATVKIATKPETAAGLMVAVDGKEPAPAGELKLEPGKHSLVYSAKGFITSQPQEVEVAFVSPK